MKFNPRIFHNYFPLFRFFIKTCLAVVLLTLLTTVVVFVLNHFAFDQSGYGSSNAIFPRRHYPNDGGGGGGFQVDSSFQKELPAGFDGDGASEFANYDERPKDTFQESQQMKHLNQRRDQSPYNRGLHDEKCHPLRDDKVNVHLIPHSHDDVGWLKTIDQYYWGDKNSIQNAGVQYIIDSVVSHLARDPNRRFVIVEMAFLFRWWRRQNEASRNLFRKLLQNGQIELICSGWSMADEAAVDYVSMIDQHTTGFEFINAKIDPDYYPMIGWQIDPFGHSREIASLFAEMGMNGLFFARLDYQERAMRERERRTDMVWQLRPESPECKS